MSIQNENYYSNFWGSYRLIEMRHNYVISNIIILPRCEKPSEYNNKICYLLIIEGTCLINISNNLRELYSGEIISIPLETNYNIYNDTDNILNIINIILNH